MYCLVYYYTKLGSSQPFDVLYGQSIKKGAFFQGKMFFEKKTRSKSHLDIIYQKCIYCMKKRNPFPSIMPKYNPNFL